MNLWQRTFSLLLGLFLFTSCVKPEEKKKSSSDDKESPAAQTIYLKENGGIHEVFSEVLEFNSNNDEMIIIYELDNSNNSLEFSTTIRYYINGSYTEFEYVGTYTRSGNVLTITYDEVYNIGSCSAARDILNTKYVYTISKGDEDDSYKFTQGESTISVYDTNNWYITSPYQNGSRGLSSTACSRLTDLGAFTP